jgi:hypothetical protein
MRVHFTFNDGDGVEDDGTREFRDINAAKKEAMLALAQFLQDDVRRSGEIYGAVAGIDEKGDAMFSIAMRVMIDDVSDY